MLKKLLQFFQRDPRRYDERIGVLEIHAGEIAIDCGANVGDVTEQLAAAGAEVHAFEPNPHAFAKLRDRFAGNPRVHCHCKAVLDRDGHVPLYLHVRADEDQVKWSTGSSMVSSKTNVDGNRAVDVETVDLAQFIAGLARPVAVLKMDIEGVEVQVLNHLLDRGLLGKIRTVLVETHDHKMPELKAGTDALRSRISAEGLTNVRLDWV